MLRLASVALIPVLSMVLLNLFMSMALSLRLRLILGSAVRRVNVELLLCALLGRVTYNRMLRRALWQAGIVLLVRVTLRFVATRPNRLGWTIRLSLSELWRSIVLLIS